MYIYIYMYMYMNITYVYRSSINQNALKGSRKAYSVVPGHRNCQIETAVWNWAGFFTEGLETCWQRFGQFLNDLYKP